MTSPMVAPPGVNRVYGLSGTLYVPDVNGVIQVAPGDLSSLVNATFTFGNAVASANGLTPTRLLLSEVKTVAGVPITAAAQANIFGITYTPGTAEYLLTEAANANTKTDVGCFEFVLPANYISGSNITITANCQYVLGSGTVGTHTLQMDAYLGTDAGVSGTTLVATVPQTVPAAAGNVTFVITGTTLVARQRLILKATLIIQDTGSSNITARINSIVLS